MLKECWIWQKNEKSRKKSPYSFRPLAKKIQAKTRTCFYFDSNGLRSRRPETDVNPPHCGGDVVDDVTKNKKNAQRELRPVREA